MLEVQEYLVSLKLTVEESLTKLEEDYAIKSNLHEDGRVILNYNQIESKDCNIVRECRGLVLDSKDWSLVARAFKRFKNAGECIADDEKFDWDSAIITEKVDGSLILVYHWNGNWHVNSRGTFGDGNVNNSTFTWRDLVLSKLDLNKLTKSLTYVLELCSPFNQVVRFYPDNTLYLLSVFSSNVEYPHDFIEPIATSIGVRPLQLFNLKDLESTREYIENLSKSDVTFEGVVCRDGFNNRLKIKTLSYWHLHRLSNNSNPGAIKNIVPLIMMGEETEMLAILCEIYPSLNNTVNEIKGKIAAAWKEVDNCWFCYHDIVSQKQFALAVCKDTRFTAPLFSARKMGKEPKDFWTPEYVLSHVFNI